MSVQPWHLTSSGGVNYRGNKSEPVKKVPTGTAMLLLAANTGRITAIFENVGSVDVYVGPSSSVAVATGILLKAGAIMTDSITADAWYGITAGATADVRVMEVA